MPHTWHDFKSLFRFASVRLFQSTCHIRGMTREGYRDMTDGIISIHMPHTWHDRVCDSWRNGEIISIHMPHTWHDAHRFFVRIVQAISIHMPHTWHDLACAADPALLRISIHMPHTWHDDRLALLLHAIVISIHMPHTWHDNRPAAMQRQKQPFQSTCHIRGMTLHRLQSGQCQWDFNPHATYVA